MNHESLTFLLIMVRGRTCCYNWDFGAKLEPFNHWSSLLSSQWSIGSRGPRRVEWVTSTLMADGTIEEDELRARGGLEGWWSDSSRWYCGYVSEMRIIGLLERRGEFRLYNWSLKSQWTNGVLEMWDAEDGWWGELGFRIIEKSHEMKRVEEAKS